MEFDVEKFKEYVNTDEGKQWFQTFVSSMGFKTLEEIEQEKEGVVSKNREVIQKNTKLKDQLNSLKAQVEEFGKVKEIFEDYELGVDESGNIDYDKIESTLGKIKSDGVPDDPSKVEELQREVKRAQRELEKAKRELTGKDSAIEQLNQSLSTDKNEISRLLIDGAFDKALRDHDYNGLVVSNILPALRAKSNAQLQFDEEKSRYDAITDDGKSIKEWVDWWKDTDEGKALRLSPINSGGGGRGSGGGGVPSKSFKEMTIAERTKIFRENPELYRKLKGK